MTLKSVYQKKNINKFMIHETKGEYSIFINSASREKLGGT